MGDKAKDIRIDIERVRFKFQTFVSDVTDSFRYVYCHRQNFFYKFEELSGKVHRNVKGNLQ